MYKILVKDTENGWDFVQNEAMRVQEFENINKAFDIVYKLLDFHPIVDIKIVQEIRFDVEVKEMKSIIF